MRRSRLSATLAAFVLALSGVLAVPAAAANLLANPGFEAGSLSGWTCSNATAVSTPVHSGGYALAGTPVGADYAQCAQTVSVQPNTTYTVSAWVRGNPVYLGVTGGPSTWSGNPSAYNQLSLSFTTGNQTSAQLYLHGWYGAGTYYADDVVLDGPGGNTPGAPGAPGTPQATTVTTGSIGLSWGASAGTVAGYRVYEGSAVVATVTGTSATVGGLAACTTHSYAVAAYNSAGEPPKSGTVTASTSGCVDTGLPKHALVGYLHASFANGSGYVRMADVPAAWDIIDLAFGEPTSVTSGDIRFNRCSATECPNVESDADFVAAIKAKQAQGKKVLISIGGQNGQVQLTTTAARDKFVSSVSAIIDKYGLNGLDVDFEGHSLSLNAGDTDFRNPTTPVLVNLISALKTLKAKYGSGFVLTMAPETFFVQVGYQFYGGTSAGDARTGAYLPVIHALRDSLTVLHVQDYNSGPVMGLDNQYHNMGGPEFHIAMTDMLKAGFSVANTGQFFPGLRPDQIAIGLPAAVSAGNGYTSPADVQTAVNCLVKGSGCGSYTLRGGTSPGFRGLMTWSINWDKYYGWEFQNSHEPFLNALP
ncbi:chitinase [Amycolatopsis mediterranei S699]|uniref:chitinase n=1 Tax=Amycolatopsis mediterranei (strain U-32) TaxID=749927 RepID=A0A0H3DI07_AMYMU|nr:glycoside hydrolase family 18 protein [Amycolatopsis mediterranei]ADJ49294.1 chitinase [Amycolatopsis mediterranei U32]AFO81002.1 chitinase [Amycolatopsis mediterranei S699]AGT88130.1 chitinase [Amycolatopsis mediterranei RB]KDO09413.1 chitinase [Amycolatopsis mediterranei]KDU90707.1 chitinase [Amycolatopsis mediterranei]